jgi:hypothetical protein
MQRTIIEAIEQNSTLPGAWQFLSEKLPEIQQVTKFNTFKGYARILKCVDHELDKTKQRLDEVRQQKDKALDELGKVRQELSRKPTVKQKNKSKYIDVPKRVNGWGVQLKGNYYRLFKKIDGKVKWIHIGRRWNLDHAEEKINNFPG